MRANGSGLGTIDHEAPSQCSTSVLASANPTAHTSFAEVAAIPWRNALEPWTLGLDATVHDVPSQCSMSCRLRMFDPMVCRAPTAHASVGDRAATPSRVANRVLGLGVATTFHPPPSQWRASVVHASVPSSK